MKYAASSRQLTDYAVATRYPSWGQPAIFATCELSLKIDLAKAVLKTSAKAALQCLLPV
jgi:hypothetical protein